MLPALLVAAQLAIKVAGSVGEHVAQNQAAKANERAANASALASQHALTERAIEEQISAGSEIVEGDRQALSASASARLSSVNAGVAGQSADAILHQVQANRGRYVDSVRQNLDFGLLQIARQREGVDAERLSRIAQVPRANPFLTGLKIGSAIIDYKTQTASASAPKG
jgi:hypothetical protein